MPDSPYRLTALTIVAGVLGMAGLMGGDLHSVSASLPLLALSLLCAVGGMGGMYWASYMLREDVRNERWPEESLAPFRQITTHVLWNLGMGVLVVAMLTALTQDRHHRIWFWATLFLLQMQTQITNAFARPRTPRGSGARLDWSQATPLRSERWGER